MDDDGCDEDHPSGDRDLGASADLSMRNFLDRMRALGESHPPSDPHGFDSIGRFRILRELGKGTFGVVLLAEDPILACRRAVKIPAETALNSERLRREFLKEARIATAIDHPNVVRVYEADDLAGLCYLIMEYCPEGSLKQWLAARPQPEQAIPERWAARLVAQIADGVHQVHLNGVVHRDLKPGNVLLVRVDSETGKNPPEFRAKVADFGLAKVLEDVGEGKSTDGGPVGTYAYMSPEQARGNRNEIRWASDVFGLGAILFELLAGARAYPQELREDILTAILGDAPPPSIKAARPDVSRELEIICRTCMAKDPRDRYTTASELADDLRRFDRGEAIRGASLWKRTRSAVRTHRRALTLACVAAAVVVAGGAAWEYGERRQEDRATVWFQEVAAADIASLPDRLAGHDPEDPRVRTRLRTLFESPIARKKIAAAVMLVGSDDRRFADYAYNRLLDAEYEEIAPLTQVLNGRMKTLAERLKKDAKSITKTTDVDEAERLDRRLAKAAAALVQIGEVKSGLDVLVFTPQPQARSFLIHTLGPANTSPKVLFDALLNAKEDDSIRRSLLQAMGEVPKEQWEANKPIKAAIIAEAKRLYCDDPDSGVHGSAKWLLIQWNLRKDLKPLDDELKKRKPNREFGWRISETGLTMVIVSDPDLDYLIEVSDCEISIADFLRYFPKHPYSKAISPNTDGPVNKVDYNKAAAFCNRLTTEEKIGELAYRPLRQGPIDFYMRVDDNDRQLGYHLPTDREFAILCRGRIRTARYYGFSPLLMKYYAHVAEKSPRLTRASLKPNDLGLFDMLGNLSEWSQSTDPQADHFNQAVPAGCSFDSNPLLLSCDQKLPRSYLSRQDPVILSCGFRVVRILKARDP